MNENNSHNNAFEIALRHLQGEKENSLGFLYSELYPLKHNTFWNC